MSHLTSLRLAFASLCACAMACSLSACGGDPAAATGAPSARTYTAHSMPAVAGVNNPLTHAASAELKVGWGDIDGVHSHAVAWVGDADTPIDISVAGYVDTFATAVDGSVVAGGGTVGGVGHALVWRSATGPVVDLHDAQYDRTVAIGVSGSLTVGWGSHGDVNVPLAWLGSQRGPTILQSAGYASPTVAGVQGAEVVGSGQVGTAAHALLWRDITAAPVDLNPPGYTSTSAAAIDGGRIVGVGTAAGGSAVALLWADGTATATVLASTGYRSTQATAIHGTQIGGIAYLEGSMHAVVWDDLGARFTDLHSSLDGYQENGVAMKFTASGVIAVGPDGSVYGWGQDAAGTLHTLVWSRGG